MPLRLPPRREPRVTAFVRSPTGFHYATADPWELRATGFVRCRDGALGPAATRVIRREKPTIVVGRSPEVRRAIERAVRRFGIAVLDGAHPPLPRPIAAEMYPELPMRAPTRSLSKAAILAISAVLFASTPPRRYAPRRQRPPEHAA